MVKTRTGRKKSRIERGINVLTSDRKTTQSKIAFISNIALTGLSTVGLGTTIGLLVKDNSNTLQEIVGLGVFSLLALTQYSELNFKTGKNYIGYMTQVLLRFTKKGCQIERNLAGALQTNTNALRGGNQKPSKEKGHQENPDDLSFLRQEVSAYSLDQEETVLLQI